jgi:hypothetical protein
MMELLPQIQTALTRLSAEGDIVFPGAPEPDVIGFRKRTGIELPPPVSDWLRICNGCSGPGGLLLGIGTGKRPFEIEYMYTIAPEWLELGFVAIGTDGCGGYYVVPTRGEFGAGFPVLDLDLTGPSRTSPVCIYASDVWHFVCGQLKAGDVFERWPFRKEITLAFDPAIVNFHGVPLPWDA